MENSITLADAIKQLLSEENKDKSLGEVSDELNGYIITIKELVESGEITYDILQKEILKHLNESDKTLPGSLAQLLIGCIGDDEGCPLKQTKDQDIPFAYDNKFNKIFPLSKETRPASVNNHAVIYFTGTPDNLKIESLKYLLDLGFNKVKIDYKSLASANYKTIYIENLKKYIYSLPEKDDDNLLYLIGIILLIIIFYLILKN